MDKFNGEDPYHLLQGIDDVYNGNERVFLLHRAWDKWDQVYGNDRLDYEVYALCDGTDGGPFEYGPVKLNYRPKYIGSGQEGRAIDSRGNGRQRDKAGEKYYWLEEMNLQNKNVHIEILGRYSTKQKSLIVEIQLLTLFKHLGVYLTNAQYTWTQVPLRESDIINPPPLMFC